MVIGLLGLGAAWAGSIDLNQAAAADLDRLPGIGPAKAAILIAWREAHGPCRTLDDLRAAPGIGAATVAGLKGRAFCGRGEVEADPLLRLNTGHTPPGVLGDPVDINAATLDEIMRLPGMFRARAEAIVAERRRGGPFSSCDDLVRVAGIGQATIATYAGICAVADGGGVTAV